MQITRGMEHGGRKAQERSKAGVGVSSESRGVRGRRREQGPPGQRSDVYGSLENGVTRTRTLNSALSLN